MAELSRLVLDFRNDEEIVVRCLYHSSLGGPNPGTVRRRRQVEDLVREGLSTALGALEGRVDVVGTSGYSVREDLLSVALPRPDELSEAKAAS